MYLTSAKRSSGQKYLSMITFHYGGALSVHSADGCYWGAHQKEGRNIITIIIVREVVLPGTVQLIKTKRLLIK